MCDILTNLHSDTDWATVPGRVSYFFKSASRVAQTVQRVADLLPASPGYGYVYYHPEQRKLHAVLGDGDDQQQQKWHNALKAIRGIQSVSVVAETHPKDPDDWVLVKKSAAPLGFIGKPMDWAGKLTGGPSPFSNALAGAMMTGGLGYGTGWLLERLFPKRFVERGRLRKTLGVLGAGAGAAIPAWQWQQNMATANAAGKPMGALKGLVTPTNKMPIDPAAWNRIHSQAYTMGPEGAGYDPTEAQYVGNKEIQGMVEWLGDLPDAPDRFTRAAAGITTKMAQGLDAGGAGLQSVPMDAFNRAIWNDVRSGMTARNNPYGTKDVWGNNDQPLHTPPQLGAATAGLATGVQQMYGNQSVLSPMHFIRGLATAGVDLATARIVGGTLGALGGLTPVAQQKLQDIGIWGGLIRGTVGSMLGMR